jgi:peptidoglycan/xylan/chitin deacetylase (PgdA/CDA1 family)
VTGWAPVPVLMYHQVAERFEAPSRLSVTPEAFGHQMAYLDTEGYHPITGARLGAAMRGDSALPERPVVLTFDDGYGDFATSVWPVLERHGFTASVFVTTGWVHDAHVEPAVKRPGPMLRRDQVRELAEAGIEIGAHSHGHPQLDQLSRRAVQSELATAKAQLEQWTGAVVTGLAYPFGYSNATVRDVAHEVGFAYAFAVGNALATARSDLFALPRLTVRRSTTVADFGRMVQGQAVARTFASDRALTKGWAMVRRTRAAVGVVSRGP